MLRSENRAQRMHNDQGRRNGLFIGASGKFFQQGGWPTADFADFF